MAGNEVEAVQSFSIDVKAINSPTKSLSHWAGQSKAVLCLSTPTALIFFSGKLSL